MVYDPKITAEQIYADLDYLESKSDSENRCLVKVVNTADEAYKYVHAFAILSGWDEFNELNWDEIYRNMLKIAGLFDGRRLLNRKI